MVPAAMLAPEACDPLKPVALVMSMMEPALKVSAPVPVSPAAWLACIYRRIQPLPHH